jgi:Zn finger protein HypA/HybF involved in hydrogenase expression
MLPQRVSGNSKQYSVFARVFGNHSSELAKRLLTEALETEDDSEIKAEIEKRLRLLEPKPIQTKCRVCGKFFEPKTLGRFKQKTCPECRREKNSSRE